jgi:signal peptidase II
MWYAIVAILILIADQGLKYWVTVNIALDTGHVTLIPGVLELTNIHNNGAAFSMLEHAPHWIFIIFTLVFAAIAVFCLRRNVVHGKVGRWSVVLVLAGAVGNCIDRILSGYVVDMFNFLFVRFAVFNLADVFIVVAGITLCLHVIFYRGDDGADAAAPKSARRQRSGAAPDAPKARRLHLPAKRKPDAAPKASAKPAPNAAPEAAAPETAPAKDDLFAAWDRAPVAAQPVTPAAPKPAASVQPRPAASVQPKPAAPAQPKPAAQPAAEAADPLLAYLNSTPAAPAEPETPKPDDATDGSADGAAYSLDDILAEFSDF